MADKRKYDIPDSILPYLNEIAERIWAKRAAVMVGAGFSKNADAGFPDWNQLGDLFYEKAHGKKPKSGEQKYLNALQLAEEVKASIGRPMLENLLRTNIPNQNVQPSALHVDLLEFPWVDVFTTNYDTLLERACGQVVTKRYEPVVNKEDLAYAEKPRIIKLHGSFPSERPFIITEEDYRRYPDEFAPFVNTVQQALLENTFCLIGFSGDDPNFLKWIGWIRDNLGTDKAQKMYLVGVFTLSEAKRQLLAERGIVVVDFSCCSDIQNTDHSKALNRFFEYVNDQKPNVLNWPSNIEDLSFGGDDDKVVRITKTIPIWKEQRESYPGWLITPSEKRSLLWHLTRNWVHCLPDEKQCCDGVDILYIYELVWRLERCLLPMFNNVAECVERLLDRYWPFLHIQQAYDGIMSIAGEDEAGLPWSDIRVAWLASALELLRFYREEGLLEKWTKLRSIMQKVQHELSLAQQEFLTYEDYLFSLFSLDVPKAKQVLEKWQPNESQPYWMIKRASALAEMGFINEAEASSMNALENIRRKLNQNTGVTAISLFSLESYAMVLGGYIQNYVAVQKKDVGRQRGYDQTRERLNLLKMYQCNPWNELELFELKLDRPAIEQKTITETRDFDVGRVTRNHHWGSTDQEKLNAYHFLRFAEEVGLPYRFGCFVFATKSAEGALKRIASTSPFWATATLIRVESKEAVNNLFDRESVYKYTANEADELIQKYLGALRTCRDEIHSESDNYGVRLAQILPEIISRLCCKASIEEKREVLKFVTALYGSDDKKKFGSIENVLPRLIHSFSDQEQYNLVPEFLKVPFPQGQNQIHVMKHDFPNPFGCFTISERPEGEKGRNISSEEISQLLKQAVSEDQERRRWGVCSLVTLHNLGLLNKKQSRKMGEAIWRTTDSLGFPDGIDYRKFAFLTLPHPQKIDPEECFRQYVKTTSFPIQKNREENAVKITGGNIPLVYDIIGACNKNKKFWSVDDVQNILSRLLEWWNADKKQLDVEEKNPDYFGSSIPQEFRNRFAGIKNIIAEVVGPTLTLDSMNETAHASLDRILKEMREKQLLTLTAEAACLHLFPKEERDVCLRVQAAVSSNQNRQERDGLGAVAKLIFNNEKTQTIGLSMLCQYLTWRITLPVTEALWIVRRMLKDSPENFTFDMEGATQQCLKKLLIETAYDNANSHLTFEKKLAVRQSATDLVARLWTYYKNSELPIPEIIKYWLDASTASTEFAEIKNIWINLK